jgi:hypothetical protein
MSLPQKDNPAMTEAAMPDISALSIADTDGEIPAANPNRKWSMFHTKTPGSTLMSDFYLSDNAYRRLKSGIPEAKIASQTDLLYREILRGVRQANSERTTPISALRMQTLETALGRLLLTGTTKGQGGENDGPARSITTIYMLGRTGPDPWDVEQVKLYPTRV